MVQENNLNVSGFTIQCPYCRHDLLLPDDVWSYTCQYCREILDLKAQFAFLRGLEAFEEGQALMLEKGPRKPRNKTPEHAVYRNVLDIFTEAYSALQVAFQGRLEEVQRQVGVEMMASMSIEFFLQNRISPVEMNYWKLVSNEGRIQVELDRIKAILTRSDGPVGILMRTRWNLRARQLRNKLRKIDQNLGFLESQIAFVDLPRARNKKWKP